MTKHTSEWHKAIHIEPWKEIYLLYFIKRALINRHKNRIVLTVAKDYYQRIIKLPK